MLQEDLFKSFFLPFYLSIIYYKKISFKKFIKLILVEGYGILSSVILIISLDYYFRIFTELKLEDIIVGSLFFIICYTFLLYLSIFDVLTYSIPTSVVKSLFVFVIFSNLIVGLVRFLTFQITGDMIFKNVELGNIDNLIAGSAFWLITFAAVKLSKEKGLGEGDVDIMGIIGFSLGFPNAITSVFFTLISGGLFSLILAMLVKKFKDVLVPLVPFITLGFIISIGWSDKFIKLVWAG